jgi:hypothetical protein
VTIGQEAIVTNADEAARQHMQQESTQEFIGRKGQEPFLVFVSGVSPTEGNLIVNEGNQTMLGDSNTMSVRSQVAKRLVGSAERRLAIDHPAVTEELTEKTAEDLGLRQRLELSVEPELARRERLAQGFDELATEDLAENRFRDKEVVAAGTNPMGVIRR